MPGLLTRRYHFIGTYSENKEPKSFILTPIVKTISKAYNNDRVIIKCK